MTNRHRFKKYTFDGRDITKATIPSLFVRFVLITKGLSCKTSLYLLLRNVLILYLRPYFILFSAIMSESDLKQQKIYNSYPIFTAKS